MVLNLPLLPHSLPSIPVYLRFIMFGTMVGIQNTVMIMFDNFKNVIEITE